MLCSGSWVGSLVVFWMPILIEMYEEGSWILKTDTLLFPDNAPHYWSLCPETLQALPCSFCPLSPLTHIDTPRASIFWHGRDALWPPLLESLELETQRCFFLTFKAYIGKTARRREPRTKLRVSAWPQLAAVGDAMGRLTSPQARGLSQWDDTIGHSMSALLWLHLSGRI